MMQNILLFKGDCLTEMNKIADGSVDMILADLPYGTTACKWDNVIPFEPLWKHYWRVLKPNGAVVLFGSEPFSSHLRMSQIKHYKYDWVWKKNTASGGILSKIMPMKNHELISVFSKQKTNYYPQKTKRSDKELSKLSTNSSLKQKYDSTHPLKNGTQIRKLMEWKNPFSVLVFDAVNRRSKHKVAHPTQKPVPLLEYLIKTYTLEGETVLDNTMGSGSTGVACVNTGRKFIGIEQDDKYFEIASRRIDQAIVDSQKSDPVCPEY